MAAGWKGGHVERLGAAVLVCDYALTAAVSRAPLPNPYLASTAVECVTTLVFLWMAFRFDRWWLLVAASSLILCNVAAILGLAHPGLSLYAAASAEVGLWTVVYASLLAGVGERWLAGEPPAGAVLAWPRPAT